MEINGASASPAKAGGFDIGAAAVSVGASPPVAKQKSWDVETQKLKLANEIQEKKDTLQDRGRALIQACADAARDTSGRTMWPKL